MACDGCVLGPGRVHYDVVTMGRIKTPLGAVCRNQLQQFSYLPGRAAMIEAEALLQCEISCPQCIAGTQFLIVYHSTFND